MRASCPFLSASCFPLRLNVARHRREISPKSNDRFGIKSELSKSGHGSGPSAARKTEPCLRQKQLALTKSFANCILSVPLLAWQMPVRLVNRHKIPIRLCHGITNLHDSLAFLNRHGAKHGTTGKAAPAVQLNLMACSYESGTMPGLAMQESVWAAFSAEAAYLCKSKSVT